MKKAKSVSEMVRASKENNNICGLTYENKNEKKKISAIEEAVRYAGRSKIGRAHV